MSILITNIKELLQVRETNVTIVKGEDMKTLPILKNAYVLIEHDTIVEYGTMDDCFGIDAGELRYSVGIGVTWLSGFGPLTFSLAKPLNASAIDEREVFQFTLGRGF